MCGVTDIPGLLKCMNDKMPFNGYLLSDDLVFMYVKNYCHFSKRACTRLIHSNMNNVKIIDVINKGFTMPENISIVTCSHVPDDIKKDMKERFSSGTTVPQIAVYKGGQWWYIGGSDAFEKVAIYPSATNQLDKSKNNPAVALKM
jgi:hypothetical protein